ncbi:hypothetical protein CURTO8I2_80043 [Curtobacterium sp. 8I-2]|nr:hypothetical protein CURTO8I2_80043 [Curtobacterium sp. 8I-2]
MQKRSGPSRGPDLFCSRSGVGVGGHDSPRVVRRVVTFRRLAARQATGRDRWAGGRRGLLTARGHARPDGTPDGLEARGGRATGLQARGWSRPTARGASRGHVPSRGDPASDGS